MVLHGGVERPLARRDPEDRALRCPRRRRPSSGSRARRREVRPARSGRPRTWSARSRRTSGCSTPQPARRRDPIQPGHPQIHQARPQACARRPARSPSVGGARDKLDAVEQSEQRRETFANESLVVGEHHSPARGPPAPVRRSCGNPQLDAEAGRSRLGEELAAEQLGPFAHPGQFVPGPDSSSGAVAAVPFNPRSSITSTVLCGRYDSSISTRSAAAHGAPVRQTPPAPSRRDGELGVGGQPAEASPARRARWRARSAVRTRRPATRSGPGRDALSPQAVAIAWRASCTRSPQAGAPRRSPASSSGATARTPASSRVLFNCSASADRECAEHVVHLAAPAARARPRSPPARSDARDASRSLALPVPPSRTRIASRETTARR